MIHRRPILPADRDMLILQATSAVHCWSVVLAGAAFVALAGFIHFA
jgi:hypothetical protein